MVKIDLIANRLHVENNIKNHNMTLVDAVRDYLDSHEIPYEKIRQHFDAGMMDKIKAKLAPHRKSHTTRKPMFPGFIKG